MDLPEAYLDDNENGRRDDDEQFLDFNADQAYSPKSGKFTGVLCESGCDDDPPNTLNVRQSLVIVLSGSILKITGPSGAIDLDQDSQDVAIHIRDARGQVPPSGTTIVATATQGSIDDPSSYTQDRENTKSETAAAIGRYTFHLEPGDQTGNGSLLITATTPAGIISRMRFPITQRQ